jgi:hypothetical protein
MKNVAIILRLLMPLKTISAASFPGFTIISGPYLAENFLTVSLKILKYIGEKVIGVRTYHLNKFDQFVAIKLLANRETIAKTIKSKVRAPPRYTNFSVMRFILGGIEFFSPYCPATIYATA